MVVRRRMVVGKRASRPWMGGWGVARSSYADLKVIGFDRSLSADVRYPPTVEIVSRSHYHCNFVIWTSIAAQQSRITIDFENLLSLFAMITALSRVIG